MYEDELDLQRSGSYLDSSVASAWSERSLDTGDIRVRAGLLASFGCLLLETGPGSLLPCRLGSVSCRPLPWPSLSLSRRPASFPPSLLLPPSLFRCLHTPPK